MSTTVFCTFEQQDLADLAVGRLRGEISGIKSIHYIVGFNQEQNQEDRRGGFGFLGLSGLNEAQAAPPRPVTVKIVCSDRASGAVKAKLVNLRAYDVITVR